MHSRCEDEREPQQLPIDTENCQSNQLFVPSYDTSHAEETATSDSTKPSFLTTAPNNNNFLPDEVRNEAILRTASTFVASAMAQAVAEFINIKVRK